MAKFAKKKDGDLPAVSTASLPDIVFMLLFFFMTVTTMKDSSLLVENLWYPISVACLLMDNLYKSSKTPSVIKVPWTKSSVTVIVETTLRSLLSRAYQTTKTKRNSDVCKTNFRYLRFVRNNGEKSNFTLNFESCTSNK